MTNLGTIYHEAGLHTHPRWEELTVAFSYNKWLRTTFETTIFLITVTSRFRKLLVQIHKAKGHYTNVCRQTFFYDKKSKKEGQLEIPGVKYVFQEYKYYTDLSVT